MNELKTIIGLEIHLELNTKTKMFCQCRNEETSEPNKFICEICLGYPGVLPSPNKEAIISTLKLGLALNCQIPKEAKFDRKHYFYPDLPKNYQISQYDKPFACKGGLKIKAGEKKFKTIRITRVHLEEDAGKLMHPQGANYSLVDFNRSGVPLVETVTEPDINSPLEAKKFLQDFQLIVRYLAISNADMEKGQLRCDANISVRRGDESTPIFEIKNMNSFRAVEKALTYEENYLKENFEILKKEKGKRTLTWLEAHNKTLEMRAKEEAADYRYFPEPDIPVFYPHKILNLQKIKLALPELPNTRKEKLLKKFNLAEKEAEILVAKPLWYKYFLRVAKIASPIKVADWMINEKLGIFLKPEDLAQIIQKIDKGEITRSYVKKIILPRLLKKEKMGIILKEGEKLKLNLDKILQKVLVDNQDAVNNYKNGKEAALQFLLGQVMEKTQGKINPQIALQKIKKMLK